jgi:CHAT domain-containing protein
VAIFIPFMLNNDMDAVCRELAQAYSEKRTMEVRFPGAAYAPLRQQRGETASELHSESFIKAELTIRKQLNKMPNDPGWLQAKGRVELLDHNFEAAIQSLQRAMEMQSDSPQLLTDLATGFFEEAEAGNRYSDYGNAVEYLGQALSRTPNDPTALFNRAIVCEKIFLYEQAVKDWETYLRVDGSGGWAEEARHRLARVRAKISQHERNEDEPLLGSAEFTKLSFQDARQLQRVDARIEDYLHEAITKWLPRAYPRTRARGDQVFEAQSALRVLGRLLKERHGDDWLADLLSADLSADFPGAVTALAQAVTENDLGDTDTAQRSAGEADSKFSGNLAGALRARVEYIFSGHIAQDGKGCLKKAMDARQQIERHHYTWLLVQYHLETGTCYWLAGNLGRAREFYERAAREASKAEYAALYLRTQDHLAAFDLNSGNFRASWDRLHRALERFWAGTYPAMRGYNLYYNLQESARIRSQAHLQKSVWSNGLRLSDSFTDQSLRAMAHSLMADAAIANGETDSAQHEFGLADRLFSDSPQTRATRVAKLEAATRLAEVEIGAGEWQKAAEQLPSLELEVAKLSDNFLGLLYYTNVGELQTHFNDTSHAEASLRSAISLAEQDLQSLKDERTKLEWSRRSSDAYRNLAELKLRQGRVDSALEIWEWYRGAELRQGDTAAPKAHRPLTAARQQAFRFVPPPGLAGMTEPLEVSKQLPALVQVTTLSFMRLRDKYVGWVYDDRGIFFYAIPETSARIDALAGNFRRLCSDPKSDINALRQQARVLYDLLIAPAVAKTGLRRSLAVEADGALNGIAFEALMDPQSLYLAERYSVTSSLGLYYQTHLHAPRMITADAKALIAVVPLPRIPTETTLQFLPDAVDEGEMVKDKFHSANILENQDATIAAVRSIFAKAEIFHFAGHAVASERQTGLLLWDSLLGAESLKHIDFQNLQLAVLSGCDTAGEIDGDDYNPDDLIHPFIFAGVPRVVVSRWNVDSVATKQFMELFYEGLLGGRSVAQAVSSAGAVLRAKHETGHPYYWSAFTEFGAN